MLNVNILGDFDNGCTPVLSRCESEISVSITHNTTYIDILVDTFYLAIINIIYSITLIYDTFYGTTSLTDNTTNSSVQNAVLSVSRRDFSLVHNIVVTVNFAIDSRNLTDNTTH